MVPTSDSRTASARASAEEMAYLAARTISACAIVEEAGGSEVRGGARPAHCAETQSVSAESVSTETVATSTGVRFYLVLCTGRGELCFGFLAVFVCQLQQLKHFLVKLQGPTAWQKRDGVEGCLCVSLHDEMVCLLNSILPIAPCLETPLLLFKGKLRSQRLWLNSTDPRTHVNESGSLHGL